MSQQCFSEFGRKSCTNICETSLHLFLYIKMDSQLLVMNLTLLCYHFLHVWCCFLRVSLFVLPSPPPLWFSLSSLNQQIWPPTLQLNAIKLLSILQLVAPQKRQCSPVQCVISACIFFRPCLVSVTTQRKEKSWDFRDVFCVIVLLETGQGKGNDLIDWL